MWEFQAKLHETMNSLTINQEETINTKWKVVTGAIKKDHRHSDR